MQDSKEFSYCIGRPWHPEKEDSSICAYAYGGTVFYGTSQDAEEWRKFIEGRANDGHTYHIYKLVKLENGISQEENPQRKAGTVL